MSGVEQNAPDPTTPGGVQAGGPGVRRLQTWALFTLIALGHIGVAFVLNQVLPGASNRPDILSESLPPDLPEPTLGSLGRWELLSYLLSPILLFVRIGVLALLVQLILLGLWVRTPLREIFRAGVWAQSSLLLGAVIQVLWITSQAEAGILPGLAETMPGSLAALLPFLAAGAPIELLLKQVTVFDIGWCALFILALEDGPRVSLAAAAAAVGLVWSGVTLTKWVLLLYLIGVR